MTNFTNCRVPTLYVDEARVRRNIERMCDKSRVSNTVFRPHFKTHQSQEIARWFREEGVSKICVSSLRMAEYFAADGWEDITVAFPINVREITAVNSLTRNCKLNLLFENPESIQLVNSQIPGTVGAFLKIDVGTNRTGIYWKDFQTVQHRIEEIAEAAHIDFKGLLIHAGHTYDCRNKDAIGNSYAEVSFRLNQLREYLEGRGEEVFISYGDTPSCAVIDQFDGIDELRPGNFVFYDLMQVQIGACTPTDIAVLMVCPIVAVHRERHEVVIYGGAIHFGKESVIDSSGTHIYGVESPLSPGEWDLKPGGARLIRLSQEHGILKVEPDKIERYKVGDLVGILPIHSCLTAQCMAGYRHTGGRPIDHLAGHGKYWVS